MKYRFILTEKCQADCPHCFNRSYRQTGEMDAAKLEEFLAFNKNDINQEGRAFLMGGEPTLHPQIYSLMEVFRRYFKHISLFSNGLDLGSHIDRLALRKQDSLIFNGFTFNIEKLRPFFADGRHKFTKAVHFVFTSENYASTITKLRKTVEAFGVREDLKIAISPDTNLDIHDRETKRKYQALWAKVLVEIKHYLPDYSIDHPLPWCFYDNPELIFLATYSNAQSTVRSGYCGSGDYNSCAGLITPDFNLYFCNQTWMKLGSVFHENGKPLSVFEVNTLIDDGVRKKVEALRNSRSKCGGCDVLELCKGRCFAYRLIGKKGGRK